MLVVLFHAALLVAEPGRFGKPAGWLQLWGYLGVDLFFVISGFIIVFVSLDRQTGEARTGLSEFAIRRFVRIVPFMWLCIAGYFVLRSIGRDADPDLMGFLRAALLWPVGPVRPGVIWTLRHEALFYLVFALTFLLSRKLRPLFWLWVCSPVLLHAVRPIGPIESKHDLLEFLANPVNMQFGMGVAIGLFYRHIEHLRVSVQEFSAWTKGATLGLPGALLLGIATTLMLALGETMGLVIMTMTGTFIAGLASMLIVIGGLLVGEVTGSKAGRASPEKRLVLVLRLLGDASYSIYLTHIPVLSIGFTALKISGLGAQLPQGILILLALFAAACVGVVVHLWLEKPLIAHLQKRVSRSVPG